MEKYENHPEEKATTNSLYSQKAMTSCTKCLQSKAGHIETNRSTQYEQVKKKKSGLQTQPKGSAYSPPKRKKKKEKKALMALLLFWMFYCLEDVGFFP